VHTTKLVVTYLFHYRYTNVHFFTLSYQIELFFPADSNDYRAAADELQ